jgi:Family of unknown function (DUF5996)
MTGQRPWPALDYETCRDSFTTLHFYTQVIGKVQLALTPPMAQWAQAPLRLTARGLMTQMLWTGDRAMSIHLDLTGHELRLDLNDGSRRIIGMKPCTVADFYENVLEALAELGVSVTINPMSVEMAHPVSCAEDVEHSSYDHACVQTLHRALTTVGSVLDEFRSGFAGKQTPVNFWWGTFDLSVARFSSRPASPPLGAGLIERVTADAEQATVGFWPGNDDTPEPAFFAYTYPKPAGLEEAEVAPAGAAWNEAAGEFILSYEAVRSADDPRRALLEFCESTYAAGAGLAGWDRQALERKPVGRAA